MVLFGILYHALGGMAAGSFYLPLKRVRRWAWESGWLVNGIFSWILAPVVVAWLTVPRLLDVWAAAPPGSLFWSAFWGVLWGVGGLSFGFSMRDLGMALGYAMVLGFCAAFGTLFPAVYDGSIVGLVGSSSGRVILLGVLTCLVGIGICGYAGRLKERTMTGENTGEFHFGKGLLVALFSGIMSACMAFALAAGKPIAAAAAGLGTTPLWVNSAVLVIVLLGGCVTHFLYCLLLKIKNKSLGDYTDGKCPLLKNYLFAASAGVIWYLQFMFYGMGTTKMGAYDFSSWTLHMALIIVTSNIWSLFLKEWQGLGRRAARGWAVAAPPVVVRQRQRAVSGRKSRTGHREASYRRRDGSLAPLLDTVFAGPIGVSAVAIPDNRAE